MNYSRVEDMILPDVPMLPEEYEENVYKVKMKSVFENGYVVVANTGELYVPSEAGVKGSNLKLIFDENEVKIKYSNNKFVKINDKGMLVANSSKKDATIFKLYKTGKDEYVLQDPNGNFVRVREKDNQLVSKAQNTGARTRFKFKVAD